MEGRNSLRKRNLSQKFYLKANVAFTFWKENTKDN
jgi:hypothetical protein